MVVPVGPEGVLLSPEVAVVGHQDGPAELHHPKVKLLIFSLWENLPQGSRMA